MAVYLFGSVARGEARTDSDVDVGILFEKDPPATLDAPQFGIEAALERKLGRAVQVVALNRASSDLVHRVLRDGRIVLDRDRAARIRFEVRKRNEYFDMAPIRRLYRRYPSPRRRCRSRGTSPMTDPDLVAKKLGFVETCVRELRTLARPDRIADDVHLYQDVDLAIVRDVVENHLGDLLESAEAIRRRL